MKWVVMDDVVVFKSFWFSILLVLISGCSQQVAIKYSEPRITVNRSTAELDYVQRQLLTQYKDWHGTPHQWGGTSKSGVDCSGLVKITFKQQFSVYLPRTTAEQVKVGYSIKRQQLRTGDLVFFKTGINVRHVGIMVDELQFFHASSSRGVILSRLDNPYWNSHYWQSRRVDL
ncbi:NlpC/P60 family protein [Moritella viscosa]|uniref:Gamma-DL-glutamyl hydrolase-Poly-gamma-glutamate depolymerase n=1 Tax=Moritella viscosa TaxID=80854 RepID=A0A1K9ZY75_9GAMM|nr:NlpC/P60 family protein [Moritella viscosa]SGY97788.1 Gamma-DL-glutamyl hydrolase-Poly-gamma-glutamate depolymerase [Moritella viscosa]SGZ04432.1 Gamma-DL-glutamyl hydrolase-Poly-gamma-glutamate depolymerase [Moritella viscosa]SGZ04794.1 Gamma-DL-glutamyl hydrolase-Poly-gamma-glutamate depolymerase [Moritella viscosa]SGZ11355.1 Gamma-DL-glutamyl hydrolase-Poly-gamma-glutamate depolymerase [Moritella viscosa]SGZ11496.1 Gamma-DL-glutamyl hydrolase-Poly-gamma-glutamate depolymerase [Moritella 